MLCFLGPAIECCLFVSGVAVVCGFECRSKWFWKRSFSWEDDRKMSKQGIWNRSFSWEDDDGVKYESGLWKRSSLWEDDDGGDCESSCAEKDDRSTFPCATFYTRPVPSARPLFFSINGN